MDYLEELRTQYIDAAGQYEKFRGMLEGVSEHSVGLLLDACAHEPALPQLAATDLHTRADSSGECTASFRLITLGPIAPPSVEIELAGADGASVVKLVHPRRGVKTQEFTR